MNGGAGVQCCGAAQLLAFDMSGAPDEQLVFDLDDLDHLDELLPALFECDVEPQEPVPDTGPSDYEHQGQRPAAEQYAAQAATGHPRLTGAVANGRPNAVPGQSPANPQPPLSGPLLRQGSEGRGRAGAAPARPVSG
jgi:hypothetical protein